MKEPKIHDCSLHADRALRCCHSSEAILLLLSSTPLRLTIKEMQELTGFHRNTIRPTLKILKDKNKVKSSGDTKFSQYFYDDIGDFYRRQAVAIEDLDLPEDQKGKIAHGIAYNLVKSKLKDALEKGPEFKHSSLYEALVHVKMAYPFSDIYVDESGKTRLSTIFAIKSKKDEYQINPTDFNLRIHACLCNGDKNLHTPCHMVIGALEGAIEGAIGVTAKVSWVNSGIDDTKGTFCEYRIESDVDIVQDLEISNKMIITQDDWHGKTVI